MTDQDRKERMKALKQERHEYIERARTRVKEANTAFKKIEAALASASMTIPDLAGATGMSAKDTLWYLAAMKKFGRVVEGAKARSDSYYPYELAAGPDEPGDSESADDQI